MITIYQANINDIPFIVKIHEDAFPGFFLTKLGPEFLQLYYTSVLEHEEGVLLVSKVNDKCVGLCAGTIMSSGFNTKLIKANLFRYITVGLKLLVFNPSSLLHLFKNMSKENSIIGDDGNYAELLSIAVDPNVQRSGAGRAMLQELEDVVRESGGRKLSLTTDFENNEKAIGFYKSMGYELWYDFVAYPNRKMYRMIKQLEIK